MLFIHDRENIQQYLIEIDPQVVDEVAALDNIPIQTRATNR